MNRVVRHHYPAAKLPMDLRGAIKLGSSVRVVVEEEIESRPQTDLKKQLETVRSNLKHKVTVEEAVARIRELRDEWEE